MMFFLLNPHFLTLISGPVSAQGGSSPYAPTFVQCPNDLAVRPANGELSNQEQAWRHLRLSQVANSLPSYLDHANIPQFNVARYLNKIDVSNVPVAGMAISGGGSQSGMGGLGLWQAFDGRYEPAVKAGTGGLTQCLSYLSGLSGGGLNTVVPLASNNFSSVDELRENVDLTTDYLVGPSGNMTEYFKTQFVNAYFKFVKGFPVSITDILGQLFRQYLPASWGYKDFSDIASAPHQAFSMGSAPMPIVLYSEVVPGSSPNLGNIMYPAINDSTIYEQTPFEFGSWIGGRVQAFMPTKFLGTAMNKGLPAQPHRCVNGFDKLTFAQGSTGNAWNFWFIDDFYGIPLFYKRDKVSCLGERPVTPTNFSIPIPPSQAKNPQVVLVEETAKIFNQTFNQTLWATYPNPFMNLNKEMQDVTELLLVDGSETGETIPLRPLIVPERKVDFVIAFDSSGDNPGNNWVNGTTFTQSSKAAKRLGMPFPDVPDAATFINLGLNQYPTFFGCNAPSSTPLVLYIPNAPWSAYTNYSYTTPSFTNHQLDLVFNNSLNMVTFGQGKIDSAKGVPPFSACIACGLIYKSLLRVGEKIPKACQACFNQHCWNGTTAEIPSHPVYNPGLLLESGVSYQTWNSTVWWT